MNDFDTMHNVPAVNVQADVLLLLCLLNLPWIFPLQLKFFHWGLHRLCYIYIVVFNDTPPHTKHKSTSLTRLQWLKWVNSALFKLTFSLNNADYFLHLYSFNYYTLLVAEILKKSLALNFSPCPHKIWFQNMIQTYWWTLDDGDNDGSLKHKPNHSVHTNMGVLGTVKHLDNIYNGNS